MENFWSVFQNSIMNIQRSLKSQVESNFSVPVGMVGKKHPNKPCVGFRKKSFLKMLIPMSESSVSDILYFYQLHFLKVPAQGIVP